MASEHNRALVARFYEDVWNRGQLATADEVFAADYVRHDLRPGNAAPGPEGQKTIASLFRTGFPDLKLTVEFIVAEGEYVVARWQIRGTHTGEWTGFAPTGRAVTFAGVNIFRFTNGKVVELWNHRDDLGLMQQIGAPIHAGQPPRCAPVS